MGLYIFASAALLAIAALFAWNPPSAVWALSFGADLDALRLMAWAVFAVAVAVAAPPAARKWFDAQQGEGERGWGRGVPGAAALFLLLFLFRSQNHYLGDGYLIASLLDSGEPLREFRPEWGTLLVHAAIFRIFHALSITATGATIVAVVSSLSGVVFIGAVWGFCRSLAVRLAPARPRPVQLLLGATLLGGAELQLYFGYVECYTTAHLFLFLYLASGVKSLILGNRSAAPYLFLLLAILAHAVTVVFIPSALLLYGATQSGRFIRRIAPLAWLMTAIVYLTLPTLSQCRITPFGMFLPWFFNGADSPWGLLSPRQLLFVLNLFLVMSPVPLLLALFSIRGKGRPEPEVKKLLHFTGSAALCAFGFAAVMIPYLGPRDWDLFSLFSIPVAIWSVVWFKARAGKVDVSTVSIVSALTGLILLFPWIVGNASPAVGEDRAARLALNDPHHFWREEIKAVSLAGVMWDRGGRENPLKLYEEAARRRPDSYTARYNVGIVYWGEDRLEEALPHLEAAAAFRPDLQMTRYFLGSTLFHLERGDFGEEQFRKFLEREPGNPSAAGYLGRILMWKGEWKSAKEQLIVALQAPQDEAEVNVWLGQTCYELGEKSEAVRYLTRALELNPDFARAREVLESLKE